MLNKTQLLPDRPGIPPMAKLPEPEVIDPSALAKAYAAGEIDLICVLGPTASGKTRYAVQLAHKMRFSHPFGVRNDSVIPSEASVSPEIISADSRQVYVASSISMSIRRLSPRLMPMSGAAGPSPSCAAGPACTSNP